MVCYLKFALRCVFYQADSLRVHGVAIPTIDGIRNVLKHIGAQTHGKGTHVLWINLREEPVKCFIFLDSYSNQYVLCMEWLELGGFLKCQADLVIENQHEKDTSFIETKGRQQEG